MQDDDLEISTLVQTHATRHRAPDTLRAAIRAAAQPAPDPLWQRLLRANIGLQLTGAFAAGVLAVALAGPLFGPSAFDSEVALRVDSHVRALQAGHLADVVSTDQHTVKPWFAGKLDFTPPVRDFAPAGFPLSGGRLEVLEGRSAAALVYRHRQHVINVFIQPDTRQPLAPQAAPALRGFNLVHWRREGMDCWAVSDLNAAELLAFAQLNWQGT